MAITTKLFMAAAIEVGHQLYIGAPGTVLHCDVRDNCPDMTCEEWEYACEYQDVCFGYATSDGTFYSLAEVEQLLGRPATAQSLRAAGLI